MGSGRSGGGLLYRPHLTHPELAPAPGAWEVLTEGCPSLLRRRCPRLMWLTASLPEEVLLQVSREGTSLPPVREPAAEHHGREGTAGRREEQVGSCGPATLGVPGRAAPEKPPRPLGSCSHTQVLRSPVRHAGRGLKLCCGVAWVLEPRFRARLSRGQGAGAVRCVSRLGPHAPGLFLAKVPKDLSSFLLSLPPPQRPPPSDLPSQLRDVYCWLRTLPCCLQWRL